MYDDRKGVELIEQFRAENYRLYHLSSQSVFGVALRAEETGDAEPAARLRTLVLQVLVAKAHPEPGAGLVHGTGVVG